MISIKLSDQWLVAWNTKLLIRYTYSSFGYYCTSTVAEYVIINMYFLYMIMV